MNAEPVADEPMNPKPNEITVEVVRISAEEAALHYDRAAEPYWEILIVFHYDDVAEGWDLFRAEDKPEEIGGAVADAWTEAERLRAKFGQTQ